MAEEKIVKMTEELYNSISKYIPIQDERKAKGQIQDFIQNHLKKKFNYIHNSISALELVIKLNRGPVADYIWNQIADENGYISNISIEYLTQRNWRDIGRLINRGVDLFPETNQKR